MNNKPIAKGNWEAHSIFKEAWRLVSGIKLPIFFVLILFSVLKVINNKFVHLVLSYPMSGLGHARDLLTYSVLGALALLFSIITWLIACMFIIIGVKKVTNNKVNFKEIFSLVFSHKLHLTLLGMIVFLLIFIYGFLIGFLSEILPVTGIIFAIIAGVALVFIVYSYYVFCVPLIVLQNITVWKSIRLSYKAMYHNFWLILKIYILGFIIDLSIIITLGIAIIWILPFKANYQAILFRNIFNDNETQGRLL